METQKLEAAKEESAAQEGDGNIQRLSSLLASPLHVVKKPDRPWCCWGDKGRLNNITVPDTYLLPNMMDFSSRVAGCSIFQKFICAKDIIRFLCTLKKSSRPPIITLFGLFKFLLLTFGLRNTGSTFQRLMDWVLAWLAFAFI
jgi:hypothetical protein